MSDDERYERELLENVNELRTFLSNFKLIFNYNNQGVITTYKHSSEVRLLQKHYIRSDTRKLVFLEDWPNNYAHSKEFSRCLEVLRDLFLENIDDEFTVDDRLSLSLNNDDSHYYLGNTELILPICSVSATNEEFVYALLHTRSELNERSIEVVYNRIEDTNRKLIDIINQR